MTETWAAANCGVSFITGVKIFCEKRGIFGDGMEFYIEND